MAEKTTFWDKLGDWVGYSKIGLIALALILLDAAARYNVFKISLRVLIGQ